MPRGANRKREREYEHLKDEFKSEGRYPGREEEVAARIVNKQRREYGETREARQKDRQGASPDRNLPLDNYEHLAVSEVLRKVETLSDAELERIRRYEEQHKQRKTLLARLDRRLHHD